MDRPTVYLICFEQAIGNPANSRAMARHYIGYAGRGLERRLREHRRGNGARIMAAVVAARVGWMVVRTWRGGRDLERRLKNRKNAGKLCPVCRGWLLRGMS